MAKIMARLEGATVVNLEWCADAAPETQTLKAVGDRMVTLGDTYEKGSFYREGQQVLTPMEAELDRLRQENADMKAALEILEVRA